MLFMLVVICIALFICYKNYWINWGTILTSWTILGLIALIVVGLVTNVIAISEKRVAYPVYSSPGKSTSTLDMQIEDGTGARSVLKVSDKIPVDVVKSDSEVSVGTVVLTYEVYTNKFLEHNLWWMLFKFPMNNTPEKELKTPQDYLKNTVSVTVVSPGGRASDK